MMTETVIKWDRPQMVGNFYCPYRISWSDAYYELEKTFTGIKRDHSERKGAFLYKKNEVNMKIEKAYVDYIPDDALDRYYGGSDEEGYDEWDEWDDEPEYIKESERAWESF